MEVDEVLQQSLQDIPLDVVLESFVRIRVGNCRKNRLKALEIGLVVLDLCDDGLLVLRVARIHAG